MWLRLRLVVLLATGGVLPTGCAPRALLVADAVGPDPQLSSSSSESGELVVYTDVRKLHTDDDSRDYVHRPYVVLDANRRVVAEVTNDRRIDLEPEHVRLQPGTYLVRGPGLAARTPALRATGDVEVPVRVDAGKTTVVHLDAPWQPPPSFASKGLAAFASGDWRLGWSTRAGAMLGTESAMRYVGSARVAAFLGGEREAIEGVPRISFDAHGDNRLGDLKLGTARLAGVAGTVEPEAGLRCSVIGYDPLVLVVRSDLPVTTLSRQDALALASGSIDDWSAIGGPERRLVLLAARGVGAEAVVDSARAVMLDAGEVVRRVANAEGAVGITTLASTRGAPGVRVMRLDGIAGGDDGAFSRVPLSLCARERDADAIAVVEWATGREGQRLARATFGDGGAARHGASAGIAPAVGEGISPVPAQAKPSNSN